MQISRKLKHLHTCTHTSSIIATARPNTIGTYSTYVYTLCYIMCTQHVYSTLKSWLYVVVYPGQFKGRRKGLVVCTSVIIF